MSDMCESRAVNNVYKHTKYSKLRLIETLFTKLYPIIERTPETALLNGVYCIIRITYFIINIET